ncbi:MAG: BMC domain-containing protein [Planctomycetota bacterium]|nr:MAG: BMC domain-containing protein [Planctomycetota bacterium]
MEFSERVGASTEPEAAQPSIGLIESASIAKGFEIADAVAKRSPVQLLWARTVSPGHHLTLFAGDVSETTYAFERGVEVGGKAVLDRMLIPNVHVDLVPAIRGPRRVDLSEALGIVELKTVASTVLAADAAAKACAVELVEVRLAMHLGGKGFFLLAGETGDVEEAVAAAVERARARDALVRDVVIPRLSAELAEHIV